MIRTLQLAAEAYGFDLSTPFEQMPRKTQNLILYGPESGGRNAADFWDLCLFATERWTTARPRLIATGCWITCRLPNVRCATANGSSGKPGSQGQRHVHRRFHGAAGGARGRGRGANQTVEREERIAGRIMKEIAERLGFLNAVGLGYISLGRSAATLSRRRRSAHSSGHANRLEAARRAVRAR